MKPGPRIWASNPLWIGGPDAGVASKVPASTGQLADGYYRNLRVSPQIWNFEEWAQATKLHHTAAMRCLNLTLTDYGAAGAGLTGLTCDGMWDPAMLASVIQCGAGANTSEAMSLGGLTYIAGRATAWASNGPRVACNANPLTMVHGQVRNFAAAPGSEVMTSPAGGPWVAWGGAIPALLYTVIEHDWAVPGLWVVGDSGGGGAPAIMISAGPGTGFAAPAGLPGFVGAIPVLCLEHSHHRPGDVYPADPGNVRWMALTGTQISSTSNGNVWTVAQAHGIAFPVDLAYSKSSTKWIVLDVNTGLTQSTDNGVTWTPIAGLPGGVVLSAIGLNCTEGRIACDGYGCWMAGVFDAVAGAFELYASVDDGVTWTRVFTPTLTTATVTGGSLWYGGGRFHVVVFDSAGAPPAQVCGYATFKAGE